MSSITSPMRIASRAALAMASGGVSSADGIEVARLGRIVGQRLVGQQALGDARDLLGPEDEEKRERHVEEEVEEHDFLRGVELEAGDPSLDVLEHGNRQHAADELEQEVAQRDAACLRRRAQGRQHAEDAAAEIGAEHEARARRAARSSTATRASP
jgi:hypothetical protein